MQENYLEVNTAYRVLSPLLLSVWFMVEPLRLFFGYVGNLQEKVPQLTGFWLFTLIPQLPITFFFIVALPLRVNGTSIQLPCLSFLPSSFHPASPPARMRVRAHAHTHAHTHTHACVDNVGVRILYACRLTCTHTHTHTQSNVQDQLFSCALSSQVWCISLSLSVASLSLSRDAFMYVSTSVCIYACMRMSLYLSIYPFIYVYMYAHICAPTCPHHPPSPR